MSARLVVACVFVVGCDAIAPVDLHYVGDGGTSDHVAVDTGPVEPVGDADPGSGPSNLCGCDFDVGESCCLPSGGEAAFCTLNGAGCAEQGGVAIGCNVSTSDSACCWNGAAKPGSLTRYAAACTEGPTSCSTDAECNGGTCVIQKCGTVSISACDVTPACP
jgi:hypothetical protein